MSKDDWQETLVIVACGCVLMFSVVAFLGWF